MGPLGIERRHKVVEDKYKVRSSYSRLDRACGKIGHMLYIIVIDGVVLFAKYLVFSFVTSSVINDYTGHVLHENLREVFQ